MSNPKYKVKNDAGEIVREFSSLTAARIFIRNTHFFIQYNKAAILKYCADENDRPSYALARPND